METKLKQFRTYTRTPVKSNLISPHDANSNTPQPIADTFARVLMFGGASPNTQVAMRVATAFDCLSIVSTGSSVEVWGDLIPSTSE